MDPTRLVAPLAEFLEPVVPGVGVFDIERLAGGWEADIYGFEIQPALPSGIDRLVLRVFSGSDGGRKALLEYNGLRLLSAAGYPVPEVVAVSTEPRAVEGPFLIMEWIDGPLLGDSISKDGQLIEEAASDFVGLMIDLHNLDWRPFAVPLTGYQDVDPLAHAANLLRSWRTEARQFAGFAEPAAWLTEQISRVAPEPPAVIHRDFHPWNVLVDPVRGPRVIDWTGITVFDRRYDVAWSLLLAGAYLGDEARSSFEGLYRQACGSPMGNLEYFDVLAATLRLHHMVVSLTSSPEEVGMRSGAAGQMREHVGAYRWIADLLADRTGLVIPEVEELLARLS